MAKKKKKQVRDSRGYGQASRSLPPSTGAAVPTSRANKPSSNTATTKVTANIHQLLQEVLELLVLDETPSVALHGQPDAKLVHRIGTLYDRLTGFSFSVDQIKLCIAAVGATITLESALDWLCLHIRTTDLPPLFTEGLVRDAEANPVQNGPALQQLDVIAAAANPVSNVGDDADVASRDDIRFEEPELAQVEKYVTDDTVTKEEVETKKAWLLQQYQYEETDSDNGADEGPSLLSAVSNNMPAVIVPEENTTETTCIHNDDDDDKEQSPIELRLVEMRKELAELEADAMNEASNYMRSKHEVKELQKKVKVLRQQVAGLERKLQRQNMKGSASEPAAIIPETVSAETTTADVAVDEDEPGLFSMFEESSEPTVKATKPAQRDVTIHIPEDSIPANWTGSTPKLYLEGWCRKEKLPKPIFKKGNNGGCHLRVRLSKTTFVQAEIERTTFVLAQNYVAAQALYQMNPTLPLYRMFPPFYRELWLSWQDAEVSKQNERDALLSDQRLSVVNELVGCIPKAKVNTAQPKLEGKREVVPTETVVDTWDQDSTDSDSPVEASSAAFVDQVVPLSKPQPGAALQKNFLRQQRSSKYQDMLSIRKKLPIFSHRDSILETIRKNPVTILYAETGSGKTTQCSSFILEQALANGRGDKTSVLCTQPRRVAAMSVAERVSEELAETSIGKLVGYQIRMESKRSAATRLLFCTTGVVLRRLIEDPTLSGISHVVVDEVHERQWQIDVLLVSLRSLLHSTRPDLKVILMSATLDTKLFCSFFEGSPLVHVPGRTFPVNTFYLEDLLQGTNHLIEEDSKYAKRDYSRRESVSMYVTSRGGEKRRETADYEISEGVTDDYPDYSLATRRSMDRVDEMIINYDLIEDVLELLLNDSRTSFLPPGESESAYGAVLIFLPGIGEIRTLMDRLSGSRLFKDRKKYDIIPMHSALSSMDQRRVFKKSPEGCRKIIVSTNIAETSVTIPDVVYVIDCGRVREIQRDRRTGTRKLVSTWCSKASAKQRSGRAGRVQPGVSLKLYSSLTENNIMRRDSEPELRRIPLEEVCLTILAGGFTQSCTSFLMQTPQPPTEDAVRVALKVLEDIGAVTCTTASQSQSVSNSEESLTTLGMHLARLPVDARVGKMLIFGALFKCMDVILTVAAFLSASKSPFVVMFNSDQQAKAAHNTFSDCDSDFLSFVRVWKAYKKASSAGKGRQFCRDFFLNFAVMNEIQDARHHYLDLICGLGFLDRDLFRFDSKNKNNKFDESKLVASMHCENSGLQQVVHAVVCGGLYPNVANVTKTVGGDACVAHKLERLYIQSSVNTKLPAMLPSNWVTYFEKFATERRTTISRTAFVSPFCLILFCANFKVLHIERKVLIDDWIELPLAANSAMIFGEVRRSMEISLKALIDDSRQTSKTATEHVLDKITNLLVQC